MVLPSAARCVIRGLTNFNLTCYDEIMVEYPPENYYENTLMDYIEERWEAGDE